ncbi:hypothetical protein FQA39_LY07900 [Lamprigera yunnana]|nr:hypothetical protein FQA39_LY07900 [Lamprigera yunnana]
MFLNTFKNNFIKSRRWLSSSAFNQRRMDPIQVEAFLNEQCILVDSKDTAIGQLSKKDCHLVKPDGSIPLHRAFSVFFFNKKGDLLLHTRSKSKITYPGLFTNSCCSHPLANIEGDSEEKDALGVKRAAQRRLNYELGIPIKFIPLEEFIYITRVKYVDYENGIWGENELEYILFFRGDVPIEPNPSEISKIIFISKKEFEYLSTMDEPISPCSSPIAKHFLRFWWDNLENLNGIIDEDNIHDLGN